MLCMTVTATAQQLAVESFTRDNSDQTARVHNSRKDQNNKVCAIVKMETSLLLQDFTFNAGSIGITYTEQQTGEIWIYLSPGTQRLTIHHKHLGTVRNYEFGEALKEATVYILKLKSGNVRTVIEENVQLQYFEVACAIDGAVVSIDDADPEPFTSGKFSKLLTYGKHQYTIEAPLYHPLRGVTEITAKKQPPLQAALQPAFGKIVVNTQPEQGADVFVDGEKRGQSPLTLEKMRSGEHTVRVMKTLYLPADKKATVNDAQVVTLNITMQPNFAALTFHAGGDIYVNDEFKAAGTWNGRLAPGVYKVEVRKTAHRSSLATVEAKAGDTRTITLNAPVPVYGSLNITANITAQIYVDNQPTGETTPYLMNQVLVGNHSIELRADGYDAYKQTVEILEGKITYVQPVLQKQQEKKVTTTPPALAKQPATVRTTPSCIASNINLGKVGFVSNRTWKVGRQTWSAPVTATYCNKTAYDGGRTGAYESDCRKNQQASDGHLFSWCMVAQYAAQLCPSPWRVPTHEDHCLLVNGSPLSCQYKDRTLNGSYGYNYTGYANAGSCDTNSSGDYWSSTEYSGDYAYGLFFNSSYTTPQRINYKSYGFALRCVR
jgi:uncharacterized protein (TIGR02145 family)